MSSLLGSCGSRNRQIEFHLVFFAERPCFDTALAQIPGKRRGEAMQREHPPRLHEFDVADQIAVVGVI